LLNTIRLSKISFSPIPKTFRSILPVPRSTPDDLPDGIIALVGLKGFQNIGPGLDRHFIIEDQYGGEFGAGTVLKIVGDFLSVFKEFKKDSRMAFEDAVGQHLLVIGVVIRKGDIRGISHWI
jgi:hypothetical protein